MCFSVCLEENGAFPWRIILPAPSFIKVQPELLLLQSNDLAIDCHGKVVSFQKRSNALVACLARELIHRARRGKTNALLR